LRKGRKIKPAICANQFGESKASTMMNSALFADYYEFTMLRAYFELNMTERATFSLFVRKLPPQRNFLVACGLADLFDNIESLRFGDEEIRFLRSLGDFPEPFLDWLRDFRFTGDIFAMREGTPFFHDEPILEVTAPIAEAQFLETLVLNQIGVQTIFASKAARIVIAARGRPVSDFGARRAQGFDAATKGARAFFIAGVTSTSNVAGGLAYGIPLSGTMAHSFIEAHTSEGAAFADFVNVFPGATLLVDTYDTITGVKKAITLAKTRGKSFHLSAIRLDSGDLDELSRAARKLLDEAGFSHVHIVASGGLDETIIDSLTARGAPVDMFGVGTEMATSADAPALDIVYKLTDYNGIPKMKLSAGKHSLPGRKQVFRQSEGGVAIRDIVTLRDEIQPGEQLLRPVVLGGRRLAGESSLLTDIRDYARDAVAALPTDIRNLSAPAKPYPVAISAKLARLEQETREQIKRREICSPAGQC
jgi:nicotinate phosphoribosyltransferase